MVAGAALWAPHPAVAGKEVAAHAEGKAVGGVLADKLAPFDVHERQCVPVKYGYIIKCTLSLL